LEIKANLNQIMFFIKEIFENKKKLFVFWSFLVLINLIDLYFKYFANFEKHYHQINRPFFILIFGFLLAFIFLDKKERILLATLIIASLSNIFDLLFNNSTIINYINFYFFYNNLSDILVSIVFVLEMLYYFWLNKK